MSVTSRLGALPSTFHPLLLGRVLPTIHSPVAAPTPRERTSPVHSVTPRGVTIVRIPFQRYNEFLRRYFTHDEDIFASDPDALGQEGDFVLIRRLDKPAATNVEHRVEKVVQRMGDIKDMMSGKSVWQGEYRDDLEEMAALYGKHEDAFDYDKAPARGWQEGKRDFSARVTYYRWHSFEKFNKNKKPDDYSLIH